MLEIKDEELLSKEAVSLAIGCDVIEALEAFIEENFERVPKWISVPGHIERFEDLENIENGIVLHTNCVFKCRTQCRSKAFSDFPGDVIVIAFFTKGQCADAKCVTLNMLVFSATKLMFSRVQCCDAQMSIRDKKDPEAFVAKFIDITDRVTRRCTERMTLFCTSATSTPRGDVFGTRFVSTAFFRDPTPLLEFVSRGPTTYIKEQSLEKITRFFLRGIFGSVMSDYDEEYESIVNDFDNDISEIECKEFAFDGTRDKINVFPITATTAVIIQICLDDHVSVRVAYLDMNFLHVDEDGDMLLFMYAPPVNDTTYMKILQICKHIFLSEKEASNDRKWN